MYQAGYQPEDRARRLIPSLTRGLILNRVLPSRLVLYLLSLHKFLVEVYVKTHKIDQCHLH